MAAGSGRQAESRKTRLGVVEPLVGPSHREAGRIVPSCRIARLLSYRGPIAQLVRAAGS